MPRPSSTGLPFLFRIKRTRRFIYIRDLPPLVAPFVVGDVLLPWSGRVRALAGNLVVKISLSTVEDKSARQRWTQVHPQVDALMQLAEVMARQSRQAPPVVGSQVAGQTAIASPAPPVPGLDPARILLIAAQASHDVLASHDRCEIDPGHVTPLGEVIKEFASIKWSEIFDENVKAELAARFLERRLLKDRLRHRRTALLDLGIEESECDDPALAASLAGMKVGDRLAPEQLEALARGVRIGEIAGEVEERLRENGIELPAGHLDRRALALAITRAKLRALDDVAKRDHGMPIETPARPACPPPASSSTAACVPLLSQMPARWIKLVEAQPKQIADGARYVRLFISLHGDMAVDRITRAHVRAFRDALLDCPRNAPKRMASASITQLVAFAEAHPEKPKLGRGTINEKAVGTMSTLLGLALRDEHVKSNAALGQKLKVKDEERLPRRPYRVDELNRLFRSSVYAAVPSIPEAGKQWAAWWLPVLSLYTGARLEELGQALAGDVRKDHGIDYLVVTTIDEDGVEDAGKSLKSSAARRRIPLHAALIRLGFLDYVAMVREGGGGRLFPQLEEQGGRYTKAWSGWWGRWLDRHAMRDTSLTYHSFRHNFIAELRRLKCDQSILKSLVGHAQRDVTSGYGLIDGWLHELRELNDELQKVAFVGLDLDHLVGCRRWRRR